MKKPIDLRELGLLLAAAMVGAFAVLPYVLTLQAKKLAQVHLPLPLPLLISLQMVQSALVLGVLIALGLLLARRLGWGVPLLEAWLDGQPREWARLKPAAPLGLLAGLLIVLWSWRFPPLLGAAADQPNPPAWQGLLASFYGGIDEELQCRLFLMSLLAWLFVRGWRKEAARPGTGASWAALILAALLFGAGHLPLAASLTRLTPGVVANVIGLNALGGVVFGWLFWKRGLEAAMLGHFSADLVLHVAAPFLS